MSQSSGGRKISYWPVWISRRQVYRRQCYRHQESSAEKIDFMTRNLTHQLCLQQGSMINRTGSTICQAQALELEICTFLSAKLVNQHVLVGRECQQTVEIDLPRVAATQSVPDLF
ncbi:MAG: hypothetical protein ACPHF4_07920 [Rubripirellula sp.]